MSLVSLWPYADEYFYIDFRDNIMHIKRGTPKDIADRLRKDVEAYIPRSKKLFEPTIEDFEDPDTWHFTSRDTHVVGIVQD